MEPIGREALEALILERNTWARQLADALDERDTALEQARAAREELAEARIERDAAHAKLARARAPLATTLSHHTHYIAPLGDLR